MDISGILIAFLVLFVVAALWFGLHFLGNPPLKNADATARLTGNCGDTMELALVFREGKVSQTRHWTDGCSVSNQCIEAAAMLARNRSVEELAKINMLSIMEITGNLPDSHLHCAQLAETTLQKATKMYLQNLGATT